MTTALWDDLARKLDPSEARPRLRADAAVAARTTRWGEREAVVHAPGTAYFRLAGNEVDLVRRLDGETTVAALAADDFDDPDGLAIDDVVALVDDLYRAGLLTERPVDVYAAVGRRVESRATRWRRRIRHGLKEQTVAFANADAIAAAIYRAGGRLLFTPAVLLTGVAVIVGGVTVLVTEGRATDALSAEGFSGGSALVLTALLLGVLLLHELGHALAVKRANRRVVRAGFQLYLGHPAFFIDSTDLVFATPRQRAVNAAAGPYVEAVVAGAAALVAWTAPDFSLAPDLYLFSSLCFFNVALNLIPFVELDGYWLLTDLLDTPRLRARSFALLRYDVPARVLGRRPAFSPAERAIAAFGVIGAAFTAFAVLFAMSVWVPVGTHLVEGAWNAGLLGQFAVVLLAFVVAGPVVHVALVVADSVAGFTSRVVQSARFRLETGWRVQAAEAIAALPHANELDDEVLSDLAGRVGRRRVRAGEALFRQGEAADSFFVVRRGAFEIIERGPDAVDHLIRRAGPGESFGEVALLGSRPRTATVRATSDGEVFVLDAGAFLRLLAPSMDAPPLLPALGPALEVQALAPFHKLSLDEAALVAERGDWLDAPAGAEVVQQGDAPDGFYVLVSGQAEVERDGAVVASLRAGDHFGEMALLDDRPRNATVVTTTPARLLRVDHATFHALVANAVTRQGPKPSRALGGEFG